PGGPDSGDEGPEPVVVTHFTGKVELFMEYPRLVTGEAASFLAHFSVLATGEPVRSGSLEFKVRTPSGQTRGITLEKPKRDGLFVPEFTFDLPGTYELELDLRSPQVEESVRVGELVVHPDMKSALAAAEAEAGVEPTDVIPFLLEQQWQIEMLIGQAAYRTLTHRLRLPGEIVVPQHALAIASSPVAGRLLPPQGGRLPRLGDRVEAGQLLGLMEPPLPKTTDLALRALDLEMKGLEVERSILQATARLEFARAEFERLAALRENGVVPEQELDKVKRNLRVAQAEHDTALLMRDKYARAAAHLSRLQGAAGSGDDAATETRLSLSVPLESPIAGQIVSAEHIEGEHIDAHEEIFRIVNADRMWVVAHISEVDLGGVKETPNATLVLSAFPERRIDIFGAGGRLVHFGTVVSSESRTVPIRYEIPNPDGLFRAGMFADVFLESKHATDVVAIPEDAVVHEGGRPFAYVLLDGEHFQKRVLELGIRDQGFVEVKNGVTAGERVATRGAYALRLASLSPTSIGHGHAH
ncbi:MAG: efflux RND transporter periplasmic adaptor subunit, partial [Planctomycetota bacterium]|nr:efflux RND transporter periplasmic adaptor subunit [Planctomycetota bacterium]